MKKLLITSGARLSNKGLHLGHYLGCFTPLNNITEDYEFYFVINDVSNLKLKTEDKEDSLVNMVGDILSIETPKNIRIFLQSDILKHQSDFYNNLQKITTFNQLIATHPHKKEIKTGTSQLTVLDYLFPLRDAVVYLSLETDFVLMNDDNARIIDFTRRIAQKINNLVNSSNGELLLKTPFLKTGFIPRLLGSDYKKMCNGNNNAIYLTESPKNLKIKVEKLFNTKYLNTFLKEKCGSMPENNIDPNDVFIPNKIAQLLGETDFSFKFDRNEKGDYLLKYDDTDVITSFFNLIEKSMYKFRIKKETFSNKRDIIIAKLRDDYAYLETLMNNFKSKLI